MGGHSVSPVGSVSDGRRSGRGAGLERFRITGWPWADPLPMPLVDRCGPMEVGSDGFVTPVEIDEHTIGALAPRQAKDELYLRELRDLDLSSPAAIAAFATEQGSLGGYYWADILPYEWAMDDGLDDIDGDEFRRHYAGWAKGKDFAELWRIRQQGMSREINDWCGVFHPDEFRVRARLLRDMTRIWQCHQGQLHLTDVLMRWESDWAGRPGSERQAVERYLLPLLNHGLRPFSQRLVLQTESEVGPPKIRVSLYSALCLQLANHVSEGGAYQKCAAEACDHLFVRQRGRAKHGQNRTSQVLYCSDRCAKNQAQREYRRRQSNARETN